MVKLGDDCERKGVLVQQSDWRQNEKLTVKLGDDCEQKEVLVQQSDWRQNEKLTVKLGDDCYGKIIINLHSILKKKTKYIGRNAWNLKKWLRCGRCIIDRYHYKNSKSNKS